MSVQMQEAGTISERIAAIAAIAYVEEMTAAEIQEVTRLMQEMVTDLPHQPAMSAADVLALMSVVHAIWRLYHEQVRALAPTVASSTPLAQYAARMEQVLGQTIEGLEYVSGLSSEPFTWVEQPALFVPAQKHS